MDFVDIAARVSDPGYDAQLVAADIHPARLAEPEGPGNLGILQPHFAQKFSACRFVATKNIEPKKSTALNMTAHVGGACGLPHT